MSTQTDSISTSLPPTRPPALIIDDDEIIKNPTSTRLKILKITMIAITALLGLALVFAHPMNVVPLVIGLNLGYYYKIFRDEQPPADQPIIPHYGDGTVNEIE